MAQRTGGSVSVPDLPKLTTAQQGYLEAFSELSNDRQLGMAVGPIPWTSIKTYAEVYGYSVSKLHDVLRPVDTAYLAHVNKGASDAAKKP